MAEAIPVLDPTPTERARFMAKVDVRDNGCWVWTAAQFTTGYGMFAFRGKARRAHRLLYCWERGEPGLPLNHLCRNRACVNPDHLEPVSQTQNVLHPKSESRSRLNADKTVCIRGHDDWRVTPRGWRVCRTCLRWWARAKLEEKTGRPAVPQVLP